MILLKSILLTRSSSIMYLINKWLVFGSAFLLNTIAFAAPDIHELKTYYKITGRTAQELRNQMNTLGPIFDGKHYTQLNELSRQK